jgi:hypothetical protein
MAIIDKGKLARYFITFEVNSPNIKEGSARTGLKDPAMEILESLYLTFYLA